jgi:hypothetical protein
MRRPYGDCLRDLCVLSVVKCRLGSKVVVYVG